MRLFYKLEEVCQANFDEGKAGDSANIPEVFSSNIEAVFEHCERDVELEYRVWERTKTGLLLPKKPASKYSPLTPEWTFVLEK